MPRTMLSDVSWESLAKLMKATGRVYNKCEHRLTLEGILYRMRTDCPWRDLPSEFGHWNTVFRHFNFWSRKGVMAQLFKALSQDTDLEWVFLDAICVRAPTWSRFGHARRRSARQEWRRQYHQGPFGGGQLWTPRSFPALGGPGQRYFPGRVVTRWHACQRIRDRR